MTKEELEKEAEKYIKEHSHFDEEFGVMNLDVTNKTIFQAGAEFGYNKANEWHYVKDGDLPSEEGGWVCNQDGLPCYYDWSTEQWLDCEGTQIRTTEWCNMPHKESE
jgi:hypothetical protein